MVFGFSCGKAVALSEQSLFYNNPVPMLKDTLVDLILDDATSAVQKVYDIYYMEHLPVGISAKHIVAKAALDNWWIGRSIPASRSDAQKVLKSLKLPR